MLLLTLIQSVLAGGPPAWNPKEFPLSDVSLHPVTLQVATMARDYTVATLTNNISNDLTIDLTIEGASNLPESDTGFRVLKEQADVLCQVPAEGPRGDDMPDYGHCTFSLSAGQQLSVVIAYTPKGPGKDVFDQLDIVAIPDIDLQPWFYQIETPLIGRPGGEDR